MRACICVCVRVCACVSAFVGVLVCACGCPCMYMNMYVHVGVYDMCICLHIHMRMCVHIQRRKRTARRQRRLRKLSDVWYCTYIGTNSSLVSSDAIRTTDDVWDTCRRPSWIMSSSNACSFMGQSAWTSMCKCLKDCRLNLQSFQSRCWLSGLCWTRRVLRAGGSGTRVEEAVGFRRLSGLCRCQGYRSACTGAAWKVAASLLKP